MSKHSVIEINGKSYDALTGQLIGVVRRAKSKITKPFTTPSIDGFTQTQKVPARARFYDKMRKAMPTAQVIHSRTQRTKTLMRQNVPKPERLAKLRRELASSIRPVPNGRIMRAALSRQDSKIKRFGISRSANGKDRPTPKSITLNHVPTANKKKAAGFSSLANVSHQQLERLLDVALTKADSHRQIYRADKKQRFLRKWFSLGIITLIFLAAASFLAWRYIPEVSVKVASVRANVSASVPDYTPSGYKFSGPTKYEGQAVSLEFKSSGKPDKKFIITQEASKMDSTSLQASSVPANTPVQTSQVKGTTVYIFGPHNEATWVNKGVKYKVQGDAHLSPEQVLKIAESL